MSGEDFPPLYKRVGEGELDPDGKSAVGSKRVQGGVVAVVAGVYTLLSLLGKVPPGGEEIVRDVTDAVTGGAIAVLGSVWALFGGITAEKKITSLLPK